MTAILAIVTLKLITVTPATHASRSGGAGDGGDGGPGLRCHPQGTSGFMLGRVVGVEGVCEPGVHLGRSGNKGGWYGD